MMKNNCPTDWDDAHKWEDKVNIKSEGSWERPEWKFDCGFKLDYDGPIMRVSSRFWPPFPHYGKTWDGDVKIFILNKEIHQEKFDCETLEELKEKVEKYVLELSSKAKKFFTTP